MPSDVPVNDTQNRHRITSPKRNRHYEMNNVHVPTRRLIHRLGVVQGGVRQHVHASWLGIYGTLLQSAECLRDQGQVRKKAS